MLSGGDRLGTTVAGEDKIRSEGRHGPMFGARGDASHKPSAGLRRRRLEYDGR